MSLDTKFWVFHENNSHIFSLFRKYAREIKQAGFNVYSAKAIFERIRCHVNVETKGMHKFKICNSYTSRYARLLEQKHPQFKGFFRNRELKTKSILEE